jgi:hypothetical protein
MPSQRQRLRKGSVAARYVFRRRRSADACSRGPLLCGVGFRQCGRGMRKLLPRDRIEGVSGGKFLSWSAYEFATAMTAIDQQTEQTPQEPSPQTHRHYDLGTRARSARRLGVPTRIAQRRSSAIPNPTQTIAALFRSARVFTQPVRRHNQCRQWNWLAQSLTSWHQSETTPAT